MCQIEHFVVGAHPQQPSSPASQARPSSAPAKNHGAKHTSKASPKRPEKNLKPIEVPTPPFVISRDTENRPDTPAQLLSDLTLWRLLKPTHTPEALLKQKHVAACTPPAGAPCTCTVFKPNLPNKHVSTVSTIPQDHARRQTFD